MSLSFNLRSNAAKFTDHDTVSLTVKREPDDRIKGAVADTGSGMTEEQVGRLAEHGGAHISMMRSPDPDNVARKDR